MIASMGNIIQYFIRLTQRNAQPTSEEGDLRNILREYDVRILMSHIITIDYGLLNSLLSLGVITDEQFEVIRTQSTLYEKIKKLLEEICREPIFDDRRHTFLAALDQTHNKHVSNFLRGNQQRSPDYEEDWPLRLCAEERRSTNERLKELVQFMDSECGLLDELFAAQCINKEMKERSEIIKANSDRNWVILGIIQRGSLAMFNKFIRCLIATKQHHVVSLLQPNVNIPPLSERLRSRLQEKYAELIKIIDSQKGMLLNELRAKDCMTDNHKKHIESASSEYEANKRLLDIVMRGSECDFNKFIECLDNTGQEHVSRIILEDGVVAHIVATISGSDDVKQDERRVVDQLKEILRSTPTEIRDQILEEVQHYVNELRTHDVNVLTVTQGSVGLFYFCTSLTGLQYLHELYCSEQFKTSLREIFISLLNTDSAANLRVDNVQWKMSNYINCAQHLYDSNGLVEISNMYKLAQQRQDVDIEYDVSSLRIDQLPFELIEMLLVKTAGQLFAAINQVTPPRAEVYTLITLSMVSSLWRLTFNYRKFIKKQLKRQFKRVCRPFECSPQQLTSLHIEGDGDVMGVAELNSELFVACGGSNIIKVFSNKPPFNRLEDIQVEGLREPFDIAVCNVTSQLYIADWECAIWRVHLLRVKQVDKFITTEGQLWRLSVNYRRVLITTANGDSLFLFGEDGSELKRIELPRYMRATHAVETSRKTFIVCYVKRFIADTESDHKGSVSEVNDAGQVVCRFNNQLTDNGLLTFDWPLYLVLVDDHVIVADTRNQRIIELSSTLGLRRILMTSLKGQPMRLCVSKETGNLYVTYLHSNIITVHRLRRLV